MTHAAAQVFAARQPLELETSYGKAKRIILRDVLRTDRNFHYFRSAPSETGPPSPVHPLTNPPPLFTHSLTPLSCSPTH